MSHYWLLITITWVGSAKLQDIDTIEQKTSGGILDPLDPGLNYPLPYTNFYSFASRGNGLENSASIREGEQNAIFIRPRRKIKANEDREQRLTWLPNLIDTESAFYLQNFDLLGHGMSQPQPSTVRQQLPVNNQENNHFNNTTQSNPTKEEPNEEVLEPVVKKSFSPWGGKRNGKIEQNSMWTWKRDAIREPSMPKRVRFSPWGGKRSGQLIYKPGFKGSKIIYTNTLPDLTRIISKYGTGNENFNLAGFQFIPALDKRQPARVLAIGTRLDERSPEFLPFQEFVESTKQFKLGHPYLDVSLKKDGKRKVKFSAWGGKRSPPIIGPIWTPQEHDWIDQK